MNFVNSLKISKIVLVLFMYILVYIYMYIHVLELLNFENGTREWFQLEFYKILK